MKLHLINLLKELNAARTEGVRPTGQYEGVEVRGLLDIGTNVVKHGSDAVDLAVRDTISVMSNKTGEEDVLFDILPLQVNIRLAFVNFQRQPRMFAKLGVFPEAGIDERFDGFSLVLCNGGNFVPKDGLLKGNEEHFGVMLGGEEVTVFFDRSFVSRSVELPFCMKISVEGGVLRTVENRVCLSGGERYDLPLRLRDVRGDRDGARQRRLFGRPRMVVIPFFNSLRPTLKEASMKD